MQANDGNSSNAQALLLGAVIVALTGMIGTIGLIREVAELGPKVGDIVAFDPAEPFSRDLRTAIAATPAGSLSGVACLMDVRSMHAGGGSVIIEATLRDTPQAYRVHWAGQRSSEGADGCGSEADLLLTQDDVQMLAVAAGGFGATHVKQPANPFLNAAQ